MNTTTLYERLGGEVGIASLVEDIVEAHMQNPQIRARFLPYRDDLERLEVIKGHLRQFLTFGGGGRVNTTARACLRRIAA